MLFLKNITKYLKYFGVKTKRYLKKLSYSKSRQLKKHRYQIKAITVRRQDKKPTFRELIIFYKQPIANKKLISKLLVGHLS